MCDTLIQHSSALCQCAHWAVIMEATYAHTTEAIRQGWTQAELCSYDDNDNYNDDLISNNNIILLDSDNNKNKKRNNKSNKKINENNPKIMKFEGLSPYWISREEAALNDIEMNGMILLTAPNMSGKSTIMRSTMVAALLANCGLWIPAKKGIVPRFDNYLLRTSCYDVPSESLSAFGHEMIDLSTICRGQICLDLFTCFKYVIFF